MHLGLHHSRSGRDECMLYFLHLLFTWWWTCDALVDFDELVNLFGWTWALIITYCDGCVMGGWMCGWMRYICDGWDIYAMDEIYMWWIRYICDICLYECICHDGTQKKIICRFGSLCRVLHSAKDVFAERNGHNTRQSWQNGRPENRFSSFAECCDYNTRQRNLKKKFKLCRVPAVLALGKELFKKK